MDSMAECIFQKLAVIIRPIPGNLPGGPVAPLNQEEQVQSLVRALRSHMLQDQKQNKTPIPHAHLSRPRVLSLICQDTECISLPLHWVGGWFACNQKNTAETMLCDSKTRS